MFKFLGYDFDYVECRAIFDYAGADGRHFREEVKFAKPEFADVNHEALDRALFLAFIIIGTSYYKAQPTREVLLFDKLDEFQAKFFTAVYQEGLGQFAYENGLRRGDLAEFTAAGDYVAPEVAEYTGAGKLVLQSGGKDSLLTAELLRENEEQWTAFYVSTSGKYPDILDKLGVPMQVAERKLDLDGLRQPGYLNGHVPATYIVQSLALIQAILNGQGEVVTSIGREGEEPAAQIGDLAVNHQWSKTAAAEKNYQEYVRRYISPDLSVRSILRAHSELEIAEKFAEKCWGQYGAEFSSCNVANYVQGKNNQKLHWCGACAKCANSYLLFAPYIPAEEQQKLFGGADLFQQPELADIFKGLLGVGGAMKPFECVGEVAELREAYAKKLPGYGNLPFDF